MATTTDNSRWLWLSVAVLVLDQLSKFYIATHMRLFEIITVLPVFNIALFHNVGVAFSMFAGAADWMRWAFIVLALGITAAIVVWLIRMPADASRWIAAGLALVAGGALGNAMDRLTHGYVVDFLQFHYQGWFFPTFNLADSAITVGAALLLLDGLILHRQAKA
jgi:signal peptidase II